MLNDFREKKPEKEPIFDDITRHVLWGVGGTLAVTAGFAVLLTVTGTMHFHTNRGEHREDGYELVEVNDGFTRDPDGTYRRWREGEVRELRDIRAHIPKDADPHSFFYCALYDAMAKQEAIEDRKKAEKELRDWKRSQKPISEEALARIREIFEFSKDVKSLEELLKMFKGICTGMDYNSDQFERLRNFTNLGPYFRNGIAKEDIERFFGAETKKRINAELLELLIEPSVDYTVYTSSAYCRLVVMPAEEGPPKKPKPPIYHIGEALKIVTRTGYVHLTVPPETFEAGLKKAREYYLAMNKKLDGHVKANNGLTIRFTGLDFYADIYRSVYDKSPTKEQAADMRRVMNEKMTPDQVKELVYDLEPGDEFTLELD